MKKILFLLLLTIFTFGMTSAVTKAADKTYSSDTKLSSNTALENCVIGEGVTLNLNGRGLEIGKSLVLKKNAKIVGSGIIIFGKSADCKGMTLYYKVDGKYRVLPISVKEVNKKVSIRPQFMYVSEINGYCYTGDSKKPTDWSGDPFEDDFNKEKADKILADVGKTKLKAELVDIDKVKLTWNVDIINKDYLFTYKIYYKNATSKEKYHELVHIEDIHATSFTTDKLDNCSKYKFQFVPVLDYFNKTYDGKASTCSIYTLGVPKLKSVTKVTGSSNNVKVTWANLTGTQESGYEIRISKDKEGTDIYKNITIKKKSAKSKTIKVPNGKYFYSIRTFKTIEGEKVYSDWSKPVKHETK